MATNHFSGVTLLITHYNRSGSLARLLKAFQELDCAFDDIVVSDDSSKPEHLRAIQALKGEFKFRLVTTPQNRGLGNNINKGQDAVKTPYTLYVQEDFVPKATFVSYFRSALGIMHKEMKWDIIRFYAYFPYPFLKPYGQGFSEMIYSSWTTNHLKFYFYSDHPHLRRSSFFHKFGRYAEGIKSDRTEFLMCLSVLKRRAKGLFLTDFNSMFDQVNPPDEPSTIGRADWRQSKAPFFLLVRWFYLKFRLVKNQVELAQTK